MNEQQYEIEARMHDTLVAKDKRIEELEQKLAHSILLTSHEIQSNYDRVKFAEGLIRQLPITHDGRNTWLLNYGRVMKDWVHYDEPTYGDY